MHWIFFTQPGVPQEIKEVDFNKTNGTESIYTTKRILKTLTPYKIKSSDYEELAPLLPVVVILTVLFIVLLVIGFRRWPGLVAGIIAGCLTAASVYLVICAISGDIPLYQ